MAKYSVVPVSIPWEDVEVALQTVELDGIAMVRYYRRLHCGEA